MQERRLISIVIPCYNEAPVFPYLKVAVNELAGILGHTYDVEIILVNDGSRDGTWELIRELAKQDSRVVAISFSRNFGQQFALTAGYDFASGDAVVCMDADLQDPPEVIVQMVQKWESGYDVVYAIRDHREKETRFKLWTAALFYRLMAWLGVMQVRAESGDFRLISRRALEGLQQLRECHRLMRGLVGWIGYSEAEVHYVRRPRAAGVTKYPFRRMLALAADSVLSFSFFPLRVAYLSAVGIATIIFLYIAYSVIRVVFFGAGLVPGWTSLLLAVCAFGVANLICIGIQGEYIGRIFEQVKDRPLYLVSEIVGQSGRRKFDEIQS
jgi:dolichol-phosphate mannosyltransferase